MKTRRSDILTTTAAAQELRISTGELRAVFAENRGLLLAGTHFIASSEDLLNAARKHASQFAAISGWTPNGIELLRVLINFKIQFRNVVDFLHHTTDELKEWADELKAAKAAQPSGYAVYFQDETAAVQAWIAEHKRQKAASSPEITVEAGSQFL